MGSLNNLVELLSANRPVNESFASTVVRLFQADRSKDSFLVRAKALGLAQETAENAYTYINSNIERLTRKKEDKDKRRLLAFDEEDEEDVVVEPKPVPTKPTFKKREFKKIKRETAQRLKTESLPKVEVTEIAKPLPRPENALEKLAQAETSLEEEYIEHIPALDTNFDAIDDSDREWYLGDDYGYVEEEIEPPVVRPQKRSDDTRLNLTVTSHFLVPPFLETQLHLLTHKTGADTGINIVKDPQSELALSARNGSRSVKEKKLKNEKEKQAKESTEARGVLETEKPNERKEPVQIESKEDLISIQLKRRQLPAFAVKQDLVRCISENQVTIVIGETGSGKTTQLTQFLYEAGYAKDAMIGCTQPRRVAATSVAKRVSEEVGCVLGDEVGYSIRFEDKTHPTKTKIKYMTEGVLLREVLTDSHLAKYSCIIMDEAHERSLNTDVLLGLFRQLITKRRDLKLIVTSATMNADRFTRFFGNAPQFTIPGRTFPVDVFFSRSGAQDYVETAVKQVLTIHLKNASKGNFNDGDILVFMTGQEDIEITCELIHEKMGLLENPPPLDVYPIYSTLPSDLQRRIFNKKDDYRRKVVVATNIAETSLTVDGVKYVIDPGLAKIKVFSPRLGIEMLQVAPISLANAQQRSGRAGRTGPGAAYRLYTERAVSDEQMYLQPIPEIQRTNLSNVMLLLKSLNVQDVSAFPFLDPPPADLLATSLYELWSVGALDNLGALTSMGRNMTKFPIPPTLSKLILLSCEDAFHCSFEMTIVVSMLTIPSVFYRPKERAQEADAIRDKFSVVESDHLTLLNVFLQWEQQAKKPGMNYAKLSAWCGRNFLHHKSLMRARDIRTQLLVILKKSQLPILKSRSELDMRKCLCASYFHQLAKLLKSNISGPQQAEYVSIRHKYMNMFLHPTSALNGAIDLEYVVYHELILTTKEFMSCVTAVNPEWLLEYGFVFYEIPFKQLSKLDFKVVTKEELQEQMEREKVTVIEQSQPVKKQSQVKPRRPGRGF